MAREIVADLFRDSDLKDAARLHDRDPVGLVSASF